MIEEASQHAITQTTDMQQICQGVEELAKGEIENLYKLCNKQLKFLN